MSSNCNEEFDFSIDPRCLASEATKWLSPICSSRTDLFCFKKPAE